MSRSIRTLTDEECRILIAAEEGRLFLNTNGRYEIDQEVRPDRKTRENLSKRGLIASTYPVGYRITAKGKGELRRAISARVEPGANRMSPHA